MVNLPDEEAVNGVAGLIPVVRGFVVGQRDFRVESVPAHAIDIQLDTYVVGVDHGCIRDDAADLETVECVRVWGGAANGELRRAGFGVRPHLEDEGLEAVAGRVAVRRNLADVEHQLRAVELGPRALGLDPDELAFNFEDCADDRPVGRSTRAILAK